MKQFFKMFFASMLAMIVTGVIILGLFIGIIMSAVSGLSEDKETTVNANSVLVLKLNQNFHEQSESNSLAMLSEDNPYNAGLYDMVKAIENAKTDKNIKGIFIKLTPTPNGWATLQQLRTALADFKSSKKFVYAYGEDITQGAYYIGSVADSVFVNPVGDIEHKGFATVLAFFKGTLDKLELQPEIFYAGKFKSATEPFRADKMSEPNRAQVSEFQKDFWNEYVAAVAQHTKADTATINQWAQTGAIQFPADALDKKLVDGLLYWDEVEARMRKHTGTKEGKEIKYVMMDEYADNLKRERKIKDSKIAVLIAEGGIVDGESNDMYQVASKEFVAEIRKIRKNDKIKAVVLRVNSPGGSALASEVILRELQLLQQKKPVIVSMGDVAASGGYYIACQADSIFAMPNTITGSIGVFAMLFNGEKLMKNKLGVTFDGVKTAPYADFPTAHRALTADESVRLQAMVDKIYTIFKTCVSTGRKMDINQVDSIAQGRVWTGTDALALGLVDGLGGLDRAIASAAAKAKLKDYQVVTYPEPIDRLEEFFKQFGKQPDASAIIKASLEKELGQDYEWYRQVQQLRGMNGKTMMALPFKFIIN